MTADFNEIWFFSLIEKNRNKKYWWWKFRWFRQSRGKFINERCALTFGSYSIQSLCVYWCITTFEYLLFLERKFSVYKNRFDEERSLLQGKCPQSFLLCYFSNVLSFFSQNQKLYKRKHLNHIRMDPKEYNGSGISGKNQSVQPKIKDEQWINQWIINK